MTVKDVINELKICECTINQLDDLAEQDKDTFGHSGILEDAVEIIGKYMDELTKKQIK